MSIIRWRNLKAQLDFSGKSCMYRHLDSSFYSVYWCHLKGRSRPLLLRISSTRAIHWSRACHVIFERAHRVENLTKYRADDLCVYLVCEYFCWKLGDPHFFFGRSLPFLTLSIILKNQKNLCVGSFNYLLYTIKKGSNWYRDTGVRDLEVVFFKI